MPSEVHEAACQGRLDRVGFNETPLLAWLSRRRVRTAKAWSFYRRLWSSSKECGLCSLAVVFDKAAALQLRNIVSSLMYSGGATDVPAFVPIAFLSLHPSHVDHVPVPQCAMARQK